MNENEVILESLKETIKGLKKQVKWFGLDAEIKKESDEFNYNYRKLIVNQQISAYITVSFFLGKEVFPYSNILKIYSDPKNVTNFSHNDPSLKETIQHKLFGGSKSQFVKNICRRFPYLTTDFILFAHVTFPAFCCYYTLPETINFATSIIVTLIVKVEPKVSCHIISSFYESYPMFLTSLFEKFDELTFESGLTPNTTKEFEKVFDNFVASIKYACRFLTQHHFILANNCYNHEKKELFPLTFINTLIIPQLKIRNYDYSLIKFLNDLATNKKKFIHYKSFCNAFTSHVYAQMPLLSIYGSFSYSDIATKDGYRILNHIPFYATGNEILSLYKLINLHNLDYKSFNNYCKDFQEQNKTEKIFLIDLYFTNNELFKKGCDEIIESREKIIILEPIEKDYLIEKNENFLRVYLKFIHLCEENKYEPFDAFMRFLNNININSNNMEKVPIIYKKEFHIYALKCMANEYNDKVKRYEILLSIIACKKSLKNLVDSTNQNLFEIFRYIANKCKESSYREIKFWNFISSQSIIADTKFYKQFSNKVLINYNEISIHLKEKHQKYLQNIMTYILQSNLITVITKIPKIINIIENAFSCIKNQDEKDALIFGTIISLTNNYKEEFIKYFCYCFGNFDMAIINSVNFPCFIRNKWLTIYKLFNKFVFDSNHDLKKLFYQKMFHQSIIKIYIIGDENIGKNSMIYRFFYKQFRYVVPQIIYYKLQKIFDDKLHNIYLIPINDEPKDIRKLFYPNIDVFVLCFSVANRLSFYNAKDIWYNEIKSYLSNGNLLLIGTNADFRKTKKYNCVSFEEVRNLADEINADYMECSAKEGEGIKELFDLAMKKGYQKNLMKNGSGCLVS